jgi:DNA-binding response OmpR family regulator
MSQTILIVDESISQHKLISAVLAEQSITFYSAYSGAAGVAMAIALQPDLILLDIDMPEMNGFDVCRLLKVNAATTEIPVIFLTASASMDERICGFDLQAVDYIVKPFDPAELCSRVRVALRTKRLLDLLPKSTATASTSNDSGEGQFRRPRLSMAQLMQSRSQNPWKRVPPASPVISPDGPEPEELSTR